jgi:hypothetical protein
MHPLPIKDNPGAVPGQPNEQRTDPARATRPARPGAQPRNCRIPGALWGFRVGPCEVR